MAAFETANTLVLATLSKLGVLAAGQPVSIEDFSAVEGALDDIFRMLGALEICYVPDPQHIPGPWLQPLAAIVAGELASDFSVMADAPALINLGLGGAGPVQVGAGRGALMLKIMNRGRPTGEPLRTMSF